MCSKFSCPQENIISRTPEMLYVKMTLSLAKSLLTLNYWNRNRVPIKQQGFKEAFKSNTFRSGIGTLMICSAIHTAEMVAAALEANIQRTVDCLGFFLGDGANRLRAFIEAAEECLREGLAIPTWNAYIRLNGSLQDQAITDTGGPRKVHQTMQLMNGGGRATSHRNGVTIVKAMYYNRTASDQALTDTLHRELCEKWENDVAFVLKHMPNKLSSAVSAAVANIHHMAGPIVREDRYRKIGNISRFKALLGQFCSIFTKPDQAFQPTENAPSALRRLVENYGRKESDYRGTATHRASARSDLYKLTEKAVDRFMREQHVEALRGLKECCFPLPEECRK